MKGELERLSVRSEHSEPTTEKSSEEILQQPGKSKIKERAFSEEITNDRSICRKAKSQSGNLTASSYSSGLGKTKFFYHWVYCCQSWMNKEESILGNMNQRTKKEMHDDFIAQNSGNFCGN